MSKVAIEIWTMRSVGNYVPSNGYADAWLLEKNLLSSLKSGDGLLFDAAEAVGKKIYQSALIDIEPLEWNSGVCNYRGVSGVFDVPDGFVAVQRIYEDISTNDDIIEDASILNQESLLEMYEQRARKYSELAGSTRDLVSKKTG